jgi:hypothetical protein
MKGNLRFMKRASVAAKGLLTALILSVASTALAQAPGKPNILVIFGDDIGMWNVGA